VGGDEDGGDTHLARGEAIDEGEAIHALQLVIEDQAICVGQGGLGEERLGALMGGDVETLQLQGELERFAHGLVVIHQQDEGSVFSHAHPPNPSTALRPLRRLRRLLPRKEARGRWIGACAETEGAQSRAQDV